MMIDRRLLIVGISTVVWGVSSVTALVMFAYTVAKALSGVPLDDVRAIGVLALAVAVFSWIFAYAITRVMYGVEALLEE